VGISKTEVGDSLDLLLGPLADLGFCQPDGSFITSLDELGQWLAEMAAAGEAVCVDGLATRVQRPRSWANQKVLYDAKRHTHTAQGLAISTTHGDLLWCDGGWPGSCHEHELLALAGLEGVMDDVEVASLLDRGFRGMAKGREHWHAPVGDRRTKDRLTDGQRAYNRAQAGLRALVEQAIAHLGNAWALRRWRGLLYRVRDVYRAAGASFAWAAGSTGSPHEEHRGHPHCGREAGSGARRGLMVPLPDAQALAEDATQDRPFLDRPGWRVVLARRGNRRQVVAVEELSVDTVLHLAAIVEQGADAIGDIAEEIPGIQQQRAVNGRLGGTSQPGPDSVQVERRGVTSGQEKAVGLREPLQFTQIGVGRHEAVSGEHESVRAIILTLVP
jgi:hypothetical protein